jgi:hypothetical protein
MQQELARIINASDNMIAKIEYISEHIDEETKSKHRYGEKGTPINKEYKRMKPQKHFTESVSPESSEDFIAPDRTLLPTQ